MSYRDSTIVGQPLTEGEQKAFDLRQANPAMSVEEIAEAIGYAVGSTGNMIRTAETKKGLREPMTSEGGRGRSRRSGATSIALRGVAEQLRTGSKVAKETVDRLRERLTAAEADAERTPEQLVADETARLTAAVTSAQEALDAFEGQSEEATAAWVEARVKVAQVRRDAVKSEVEGNLATAEATLAEYVETAESMDIQLEDGESEDQPDNGDESTNDEVEDEDEDSEDESEDA